MPSHKVTIYTQATLALCWEAVARMMWHWKHGSLNGYSAKSGAYGSIQTGLTEERMNKFYKQLGMRALSAPKIDNMMLALKWSPVAFALVGQQTGHALVASGYEGSNIELVNPCARQVVDFESDNNSCQAGAGMLPSSAIANGLGTYIWYW